MKTTKSNAQPPQGTADYLDLARCEAIIHGEQRKMETAMTELEAAMREFLAAPPLDPAYLSHWRGVQKDLRTLIADPRYKSSRSFCATARKFIALDLTRIPVTCEQGRTGGDGRGPAMSGSAGERLVQT